MNEFATEITVVNDTQMAGNHLPGSILERTCLVRDMMPECTTSYASRANDGWWHISALVVDLMQLGSCQPSSKV